MSLPETPASRWAEEGRPFPLDPTRIEAENACSFLLYSKQLRALYFHPDPQIVLTYNVTYLFIFNNLAVIENGVLEK